MAIQVSAARCLSNELPLPAVTNPVTVWPVKRAHLPVRLAAQ